MGKWLGIAMSVMMVLALAACSQPQPADTTETAPAPDAMTPPPAPVELPPPAAMDAPVAPAPMDVAPAEPVDETPSDLDTAPPVIDGAAAPEASDDQASLVGTKWKYDMYTAEFASDNVLKVSMGEMTIDGQYTVADDGAVEISAMGNTMNGHWDGSALTINGDTLEKIQ